jgi:hypothetical protein
MLPSNMLLLNFILLIDVTFSTPTGVYTHNPANECNGDVYDSNLIGNVAFFLF